MRKILLSTALLLSIGTAAMAQSLTILPDVDEHGYMGLSISRNGKYICGSTVNYEAFVADWQNEKVQLLDPIDDFGTELRSVSNDGVAVGFNGPAITLDMDGKETQLQEEESIAESITSDGKLIVGSVTAEAYVTHACYWKDGERTMLPEPTSEEMGFEISGTSAKYVSADGSVIVGQVIDDMATYPAILWTLEADGTYKLNPLSKDYFYVESEEELPEGEEGNPYATFSASGVSGNGRYIALSLSDAQTGVFSFGRYDLQTNTLEVAEAEESDDPYSMMVYVSSGIANDGTMVGYAGGMMMRVGYIWKAGDKAPVTLASEYPELTKLADYDAVMSNLPASISEDGNYIVGFGMDALTYNYETYVLFRDVTSGVNSAEAAVKEAKEVGRYNVGGAKVNAAVKGLNIIKMSDGTVKKVIK